MVRDICRAAESGVDVRLLTLGKPDKWYAYVVTQSHYERLLESDVKYCNIHLVLSSKQ